MQGRFISVLNHLNQTKEKDNQIKIKAYNKTISLRYHNSKMPLTVKHHTPRRVINQLVLRKIRIMLI